MNLFVDSNIFLDFYHFSVDDLDELRKLSKLIEEKEVKLYTTRQIINEIKRNRDNKVSDAVKRFRESKCEMRLPQICKTYPEYKTIKNGVESLEKAKSELDDKLKKDIANRTLKADHVIDELFKLAETIESDHLLAAAQTRYHLGNPPGKNKSYGDAVNWEAILQSVPDNEDIFFISDDKDYKSPLDGTSLNSFLLDEWRQKKNSQIFFYTQLSEFFREHHADIKLREEEEKNQLIEELTQSMSFARAHESIKKLSKFDGFSDSQIKKMVEVAISNSQIRWIARDPGVNDFYRSIVLGKEDILDRSVSEQFRFHFLYDIAPEEQEETSDDDLPF